jgi:hypothetical protein
MTRRTALLLGFAPLLLAQAPEAARKAADKWLALLDAGNYKEAYKQSARQIRDNATADEWSAQMHSVRDAAGAVGQRTLSSAKPAGDNMVFEFATAFANKPKAVETLMMSREGGSWKAGGYFIR